MTESKSKRMPKSGSLDELVQFFESHDMGEYWEHLPEAHFDIDIKKRTFLFAIDEDVAKRLADIAKAKHLPSEALVNAWLREKILEQMQAT
jgi:hypothetical protein